MLSKLAKSPKKFGFDPFSDRSQRRVPLFGVTLHTSGSALPKLAGKTNAGSLKRAVQYYTYTGGPHYVIGWDGTIVSTISDENIRGAHAGIEQSKQDQYNDGTWIANISTRGLDLWRRRWPGKSSPKDLIPTRKFSNINDAWIGVELIPVTDGSEYWYKPAYPGSRFSAEQHKAARDLAWDIARRYGFPPGWELTERLLGHSDLNPLDRDTTKMPLWDPGYHTNSLNIDFIRKKPTMKRTLIIIGALAGLSLITYSVYKQSQDKPLLMR